MQTLEKNLEQTEGQLSENDDRIGILVEHLNTVQQEIKFMQSRVRDRRRACKQRAALILNP